MAIRMREWAMLASPRSSVQIPTQGIRERAAAWGALGQGVGALGTGWTEAEQEESKQPDTTALQQLESAPDSDLTSPAESVDIPPQPTPDISVEKQQHLAYAHIQAVGDMAALSDRLKIACRETAQSVRDALNGNTSLDWETAWQQQNRPLLQETLADLPASERSLGQQMAEAYSASESLRARREHELERISTARNRWQLCLEQAVAAGDEQQATHWLQMGRGVFVAEGEMEQRQEEVTSRCRLARWEQGLQTQPVETLTAWLGRTVPLPRRESDRLALQERAVAVQQKLCEQWARDFSEQIATGAEPDATSVQQARLLGVLQQESAAPRRESATRMLCELYRRVDEHVGTDTSALRLQLATAPLPVPVRQGLLQRLTMQQAVPSETRGAVSRALWNMYRAGHLGCPGDTVALKRLSRLQETACTRLAADPNGTALTDWLTEIRSRGDVWVGFESSLSN